MLKYQLPQCHLVHVLAQDEKVRGSGCIIRERDSGASAPAGQGLGRAMGTPLAHSDECRGRTERRLEQSQKGKQRVEEGFRRVEAQKERKAKLRVEISAAPDPVDGEVDASAAPGNPERVTSPKRKEIKVEKAKKKAKAKGTEKREGAPVEELYRGNVDKWFSSPRRLCHQM